MKFWILILSLGLHTSLYSQSNRNLFKRLELLTNSPAFQFDTTGISSFAEIPNPCHSTIQWNNYHVTDLNDDGLKDLIFSGLCEPYNKTIIYINSGTALEIRFEYAGKIVSISNDSKSSTINILKEACCCDRFSELMELKINNKILKQNSILFSPDTKISLDSDSAIFFYNGIIRTDPMIDNLVRQDKCSDQLIEGNKLIATKHKTKVMRLNKKENWQLVLVLDDSEHYWLGWVEIKK